MNARASNPPGGVSPASVTLSVWVQPGASREGVVGMMGDAVKIVITAPPEKGKANKALEKFLSRQFGLPPSAVAVISGGSSKRKQVRINGITSDQLAQWLQRVPSK